MNFAGKKTQDGFYAWLNPDLPHEQVYDAKRLLSEYAEVDEDTYDYFLGMLPPMHFSSDRFAICEATTHDIRLAFYKINGRFFAAHISDELNPQHFMSATRMQIAGAN